MQSTLLIDAEEGILSSRIIYAKAELECHIKQFDWSGLTKGKKNILDAFLKIATKEGWAAVTMRSLGEILNLKAPSIYSHFPGGKDDIVTECLRWHYYTFGLTLVEALSTVDNAEDFFDSMVRVHFTQQHLRPESDHWDLLVCSDRVGRFLQDDIRGEIDDWMNLLAGLYEMAAVEMGFKNVKMKVQIIMSMLDDATAWSDWSGSPSDLPAMTDEVLKILKAILAA